MQINPKLNEKNRIYVFFNNIHEKFVEELNDWNGCPKNSILKVSENVRSPSENVRKSSVHLRQPLLVFGNLR